MIRQVAREVTSEVIRQVAGVQDSAFSPDDIASIAQWFDASAMTGFSNNDPVATWTDLVGSNDATQGTPDFRPVYKTNVQNSLPAVLFAGGDRLTHSYANNSNAITIAIVAILNSSGNTNYRGLYSTDGNNLTDETMLLAHVSTLDKWGTLGSATQIADTDIRDDAAHLLVLSRASGGGGDFYLDGATDGTFTESKGQSGNIGGTTGTQTIVGHVCEIIVYAEQLSASDRTRVTDHLKTKWGIA